MKRITSYTITCHRALNYGAVLQSYALNTRLMSLGIDAKVIDYVPSYYYSHDGNAFKWLARIPDKIVGKCRFGKFIRDNIPLSPIKYRSLGEIKKNVPQAEIYIAGSDQIWNCLTYENGKDDAFFLTFAPDKAKKFSYAASLAMPEIPSNQVLRYKQNLAKFSAISVRERSGAELLRSNGVDGVTTVLDPVYLLDREEWNSLADKIEFHPNEKYVLVYALERGTGIHEYARKLAAKLGASVYSVNTTIEGFLCDTDKYFWNKSPNVFINLVRHSEAVVTDSFHGVSFSIIYEKPFHLFLRKKKTKETNSRMLDLLSELTLDSRVVQDIDSILPNNFDYSIPSATIELKRASSLHFIREVMLGSSCVDDDAAITPSQT